MHKKFSGCALFYQRYDFAFCENPTFSLEKVGFYYILKIASVKTEKSTLLTLRIDGKIDRIIKTKMGSEPVDLEN